MKIPNASESPRPSPWLLPTEPGPHHWRPLCLVGTGSSGAAGKLETNINFLDLLEVGNQKEAKPNSPNGFFTNIGNMEVKKNGCSIFDVTWSNQSFGEWLIVYLCFTYDSYVYTKSDVVYILYEHITCTNFNPRRQSEQTKSRMFMSQLLFDYFAVS